MEVHDEYVQALEQLDTLVGEYLEEKYNDIAPDYGLRASLLRRMGRQRDVVAEERRKLVD
jgi:hypothetical protein